MAAPRTPSSTGSSPRGFTDGSVRGHLVRLGAFMAMGSVTMNIAQLAEAVYLGILGTEALAAMGFAFPITILMFSFAGGIGTGASSVIARTAGAGDQGRVAALVSHAQIIALLVGLALATLGITFADAITTGLGAQQTVRQLTVDYLQVYMLGVPFFLLSIVGSTLLRATGKAASPGIIMAVGSAIQILLGPVLIFGWFGLPALGIAGAAWAYVISRILSVGLYGLLLARAGHLSLNLAGLPASARAIAHVGAPAIAGNLVMPISILVITRLLANHGHEVVAGYNVATRVETLAHMILWSVSSSAEPVIGQNWGAGLYARIRQALRLTYGFCLGWGVLTFVVMVSIGGTVVSWIDPNPTVVEVATTFFLFIPLSIGFMGVAQVASACFNALGRPGPAFVLSLCRTVILYVPAAIFANEVWGYPGIFAATALNNVAIGLLAWYWNRSWLAKQTLGLDRAAVQPPADPRPGGEPVPRSPSVGASPSAAINQRHSR